MSGHENPHDATDVSDDERASMLADYLDVFRNEFGTTPKLMPLDAEGKAPIAQGSFRVFKRDDDGQAIRDDDGNTVLTSRAEREAVAGDIAVRQIRDDGTRGFALYAGVPDWGTEDAAFVDHDDDAFPTPTGKPTLEVLSGSGRGKHETYRNDPDEPVANARVGDNEGEIRAENWYVVIPGSIHPTGGIYHITKERSIATLADADLADKMRPAGAQTDDPDTVTDAEIGDGDLSDAKAAAREHTWIATYLAFGLDADGDRSTKDHAVCRAMIENGVSEESARALLDDSEHTKVYERGDNYWNTTWKSALRKADPISASEPRGKSGEKASADGGTAAAEAVAGGATDWDHADSSEGGSDESDPWAEIRRLYATDEKEDNKVATNIAAERTAGSRRKEFTDGELDVRTHEESEALYAYDPSDGTYYPRGEHRVREHLQRDDKLQRTYYPARARNIIATAKPRTYTPENEFGAPVNRMCMANGVLDVSDPQNPVLEDHDPRHLFTDGHPAEFDPDADCPEFLEFISKVVRDEDRKKLQEYAGYCLHTWNQQFKKAMMLVGPTNSGKGTFLNILSAVIGEDNTSSETLEDLVESRWSAAQLYDGVVNIRNEMSTSKLKHTERFKEMTGGGDRLSAEKKNQPKFTFEVTQKFLFATNEVPEVNADGAFNKRWLFASLPHTVPDGQIDTELDTRIIENELSGVLNWMLEGYARLREQGHFTGERGIEAKEEMWEKYGSSVDRFKNACLNVTGDDNDLERKDDIRPLYQAFCSRIGKDAEAPQTLTKELTSDADIEHGKRAIEQGETADCYIGVSVDPGTFDDLDVVPFGPDDDDDADNSSLDNY